MSSKKQRKNGGKSSSSFTAFTPPNKGKSKWNRDLKTPEQPQQKGSAKRGRTESLGSGAWKRKRPSDKQGRSNKKRQSFDSESVEEAPGRKTRRYNRQPSRQENLSGFESANPEATSLSVGGAPLPFVLLESDDDDLIERPIESEATLEQSGVVDPLKQPLFPKMEAYDEFEPDKEASDAGVKIRSILKTHLFSKKKESTVDEEPFNDMESNAEDSQALFIAVKSPVKQNESKAQPEKSKDFNAVPWVLTHEHSRVYVEPVLQLHNEIVNFCNYLEETQNEKDSRKDAVQVIASLCQELWPKSSVEVFGSAANGLCIPCSDVDLVLIDAPVNAIHKLAAQLRSRSMIDQMQVISSARVPIIKLKLVNCPFTIDISFGVTGGIQTGRMIRKLLSEMPALKPITLLVKLFLQQRDLNETFRGGIGSHLCLCMVISSLQQFRKRVVCSKFNPSDRVEELEDLGSLFLDFLDLYGRRLNYAAVQVSLRDGGSYLIRGDLEEDFTQRRPPVFYLENPEDPTQNLASSSYNMHKIRKAFAHAHRVLLDHLTKLSSQRISRNSSILSTIFNIKDPQLQGRSVAK